VRVGCVCARGTVQCVGVVCVVWCVRQSCVACVCVQWCGKGRGKVWGGRQGVVVVCVGRSCVVGEVW